VYRLGHCHLLHKKSGGSHNGQEQQWKELFTEMSCFTPTIFAIARGPCIVVARRWKGTGCELPNLRTARAARGIVETSARGGTPLNHRSQLGQMKVESKQTIEITGVPHEDKAS
jgi:hypothetical protein